MPSKNSNIYRLLFAGWFGVILFWMAGVPEGSYQQLDVAVSIWLTNFLKASPSVAQLLYKFNSINEAYINVPIMLLCQLIVCLYFTNLSRKQAFYKLFCTFIWVEFWILLVINPFVTKLFAMDVHIVPEVSSWISETNRQTTAAIISRHVFAMFFLAWYFIDHKTQRFGKCLIYLCALLFALPPILNVKHWLSDWLFSAWFAYSAACVSRLANLEEHLTRWFFQKK